MAVTYTLLSPVKEEELRLSFGYLQTVNSISSPTDLFAPTIAHFEKLAIGTYFWFIADPSKWVVHAAGGMVDTMTPIQKSQLVSNPPDILFRNSHPDDIPQVFAFTNYWINYFMNLPNERKAHVRATIYLRMLNAKNKYHWVMIQYADTLVDSGGKILYGLTLVTDISHIKRDGTVMMSILDTFDENCQHFFCMDGKSLNSPEQVLPKLSVREIEVLRYLAIGHSSKQIAAGLNIAVKTIDNHRQNMLRKTAAKSTGELVAYGITMGYI
ncbi:MAG: helix-turn-helix transcriptional regulator [Bacteroidota bacterium]